MPVAATTLNFSDTLTRIGVGLLWPWGWLEDSIALAAFAALISKVHPGFVVLGAMIVGILFLRT